jgi:CMP-N-acetylneuraminic acid synthetase
MKERDEEYDVIVNLQPTSPARVGSLLDRCIEKYDKGGYDSLLTGTKNTPFFWQKINGEWQYIVDKNDCCNRKMRQDFEDNNDNSEFVLHDNGNVYVMNANILLDKGCRIGYNPCVFETTGINNIQIDEEFDFKLIEEMAKSMGLKTLVDDWEDL